MTTATRIKGRASKNAQALGASDKGRDIALAIWQILFSVARRITLALMMGCIMTVASTAEEAPSLAGRWVVTALQSGVVPEKGRIFDFSPCGKKWCGVEIDKDGKCGRAVFHFSPAKDAKSGYHFKGQFLPTDKAKPFIFLVLIENSKDKLWAGGDLGDVSPFQRAFPLEFEMSRQGDATCKADAKTS